MLSLPALLTALTFSAAPPVERIAPTVTRQEIETLLKQVRTRQRVPALGAAVVTSKGVFVLAVTGERKRGSGVAVQPSDRFHLGSDTKAFTAMLIAILVEERKLTYDQTLAKLFPDHAARVHADLAGATLLQLLDHSSGLPANLPGGWERIPVRLPVQEQRAEAVARGVARQPKHRPGSGELYSNLGYVLAAAAAERVGKRSWEELLKQHVLTPLGMTSAGFGPMGRPGKVEQPWPHDADGEPIEPDDQADNPPVLGPAGRLHGSLGDWGKFIADQLRGARGQAGLLPAPAYHRLHRVARPGGQFTPGGWLKLSGHRGPILAHDGSNTLHYASAVLLPKADLAVLVVCNQGGSAGQKACHQVRDALLARLLR